LSRRKRRNSKPARGATPGACDLTEFGNWCTYQILLAQARTAVNGSLAQPDVAAHFPSEQLNVAPPRSARTVAHLAIN